MADMYDWVHNIPSHEPSDKELDKLEQKLGKSGRWFLYISCSLSIPVMCMIFILLILDSKLNGIGQWIAGIGGYIFLSMIAGSLTIQIAFLMTDLFMYIKKRIKGI